MRETFRDFALALVAAAALFAAFQSRTTARELAAFRGELAAEMAAMREELAEVRGQLQTITDAVIAHIDAPGLHGGED